LGIRITGARAIWKKNGKKQDNSLHNYWISAQRKEKIYGIANVAGSEEATWIHSRPNMGCYSRMAKQACNLISI
jgi:hypothetical protein